MRGLNTLSVVRSQIPISLSPEWIWKYERKARENRLTYVDLLEKIAGGAMPKDGVTNCGLYRIQKTAEGAPHNGRDGQHILYLEQS
jgi:hypothetical protein